jgi:hypothetical protein
MSQNPLPIWLQFLQALALPAIAGIGAWIAFQQMSMAKIKLQHDLYDRRFKIFGSAQEIIAKIIKGTDISHRDLYDFGVDVEHALFLLNDNIQRHLQRILNKANQLLILKISLDGKPVQSQEDNLISKRAAILRWMGNQPEALTREFKPVLQLERSHPKFGPVLGLIRSKQHQAAQASNLSFQFSKVLGILSRIRRKTS